MSTRATSLALIPDEIVSHWLAADQLSPALYCPATVQGPGCHPPGIPRSFAEEGNNLGSREKV